MDFKIKCPGCKRNYTLKVANPEALRGKMFRCPKCGAQIPFSVILAGGGQPPMPPIPGNGGMAPGILPPPPGGAMGAPGLKTHLGGANPETHLGGAPIGGSPMETHLGGPAAPGMPGKTAVHRPAAPVHWLEIKGRNKRFPLTPGDHILGRDSADSRATIRIANDKCMSRAHAHLSVQPSVGGMMRVMLTPMNSRNQVYVNNLPVHSGSPVDIHPGDEILLGLTTLVLR